VPSSAGAYGIRSDTAAGEGPLLAVADVAVSFGGIKALDGVTFEVREREILGLIGPNGSGKTTLFNCISGIYRCGRGTIGFAGQPLAGLGRHRMAGIGIGRTFQNLALFRSLSVRENVLAGAHHIGSTGFVANALRLPRVGQEERELEERLEAVLARLDLDAVAHAVVAALPFAVQKRVELARALIGDPRLLLLDEPAGGLNHAEVDGLARLLHDIRRDFNLAILLVEHHMGLVMRVSDRVVALERGRKIADGTPDEVRAHAEVIRAYLGVEEDA
jgi:branched-chain amino acid transport system ATP-binding protein